MAAASRQAGASSARLLRVSGWALIVSGLVVLLYLVYSLFFTGLETRSAQAEMSQEWEGQASQPQTPTGGAAAATEHGGADDPVVRDPDRPGADDRRTTDETEEAAAAPPGAAVAKLEFFRPGADERPVHDAPLFVVDDVTLEHLARGPGHYPDSAAPGADGNFAVAGHRTTYGAPFYHLNDLRPDDEVHVTDRSGERHVYRVLEQRIVAPGDSWVVGSDPLERGKPTLTMTTCHPRFSARERLVVFAELVA